jgi:hypothetical protein
MNILFKIINAILLQFNKCLIFEVEMSENGIENNNVIKKIIVSKKYN